MTPQELRDIHRRTTEITTAAGSTIETIHLTLSERRALTIHPVMPSVGRARMRRDLVGFATIAFIASAMVGLFFLSAHFVFGWQNDGALTKVTHNMTLTGEIGTSKNPLGMPIALQRQSSCETWECYYDREVQDFTNATRHGFATPIAPVNVGEHIEMPLGADGNIDWAHPIGFAVIDCDGKSSMVDGKSRVEIEWDPKHSCLHVTPVNR